MTSKTVQSRKDEILNNFLREYEEGKKEENELNETITKFDKQIKDSIEISDNVKQQLHEQQLKNARNKGYLRILLPKYPHKCKNIILIFLFCILFYCCI
jgi:hypothetical protein